MQIVESYPVAVAMCVVTMLCWGSWANTQKLASKEWRFQLFYWDYAIGVFLLSLILAFTLGSTGYAAIEQVADTGEKDEPDRHIVMLGPLGAGQGGEARLDAVLDGQEPAQHVARREEVGQQVDARRFLRGGKLGFLRGRGHG